MCATNNQSALSSAREQTAKIPLASASPVRSDSSIEARAAFATFEKSLDELRQVLEFVRQESPRY
jgi:hypothetical protein